jgi:ribosomal protein S18 acetylase RimI-like enzyme
MYHNRAVEHQIRLQWMKLAEVSRIGEIDRSEEVRLAYEVDGEGLREMEVDWRVPAWSAEGAGDHSVTEMTAFCREHMQQGGVLLGAFAGDRLVGVGLLRTRFRGPTAQLAFLHVSRAYRRRGIATELTEELIALAREQGAAGIYVSSTPSESAVGFYLRIGFQLAEEVDPELYALEPQDIHMRMEL